MNCITCRGAPRRLGIGEGLFCERCEAQMERLVAEPPLRTAEDQRLWRIDARSLAKHYARVAGLPDPEPSEWA